MAPTEGARSSLRAVFSAVIGDADGFFADAPGAVDLHEISPQDIRYAWWLDKVRPDPRFAELMKKLPS